MASDSGWPTFDVTVQGYGTAVLTAATRGKALANAWRSDAFNALSFGEFLKIARARKRAAPPPGDHYRYARKYYGVTVEVGQRVTLQNEGSWSGKEGVVLYPESGSGAHIVVLMDNQDRRFIVHPMNVLPIAEKSDGK